MAQVVVPRVVKNRCSLSRLGLIENVNETEHHMRLCPLSHQASLSKVWGWRAPIDGRQVPLSDGFGRTCKASLISTVSRPPCLEVRASRKRGAPEADDMVRRGEAARRRALSEPLAMPWIDAHVLGLRRLERVTLTAYEDPELGVVPRVSSRLLEKKIFRVLGTIQRDWMDLLARGVATLTRTEGKKRRDEEKTDTCISVEEEISTSVNTLILSWTTTLSLGIKKLNAAADKDLPYAASDRYLPQTAALRDYEDEKALRRVSMAYLEAQRLALKDFVSAAQQVVSSNISK